MFIPYKVIVSTKFDQSFYIKLPTYFSDYKYFKIKLIQSTIVKVDKEDITNTELPNIWLCSDNSYYDQLIVNNFELKHIMNYLFNITAFEYSDSNNYQFIMQYKDSINFCFDNYTNIQELSDYEGILIFEFTPYEL